MKKGDTVRIGTSSQGSNSLISDNYRGMTGTIVNYMILDAKIPVWSVLVDGAVIPVRETQLELIDG